MVRPERVDLDAVALAADLRYELIPDAGHFLPEEAPERVNQILLEWLARVCPAPSPAPVEVATT
jgi:pimeloyl-ACP methyl ester carboxylesterase